LLIDVDRANLGETFKRRLGVAEFFAGRFDFEFRGIDFRMRNGLGAEQAFAAEKVDLGLAEHCLPAADHCTLGGEIAGLGACFDLSEFRNFDGNAGFGFSNRGIAAVKIIKNGYHAAGGDCIAFGDEQTLQAALLAKSRGSGEADDFRLRFEVAERVNVQHDRRGRLRRHGGGSPTRHGDESDGDNDCNDRSQQQKTALREASHGGARLGDVRLIFYSRPSGRAPDGTHGFLNSLKVLTTS
jgi:hypothetical protein